MNVVHEHFRHVLIDEEGIAANAFPKTGMPTFNLVNAIGKLAARAGVTAGRGLPQKDALSSQLQLNEIESFAIGLSRPCRLFQQMPGSSPFEFLSGKADKGLALSPRALIVNRDLPAELDDIVMIKLSQSQLAQDVMTKALAEIGSRCVIPLKFFGHGDWKVWRLGIVAPRSDYRHNGRDKSAGTEWHCFAQCSE